MVNKINENDLKNEINNKESIKESHSLTNISGNNDNDKSPQRKNNSIITNKNKNR